MFKKYLPFLVILLIAFSFYRKSQIKKIKKDSLFLEKFDTMIEVIYYHQPAFSPPQDSLRDKISNLFDQLNKTFSSYDSTSEVYQVNHNHKDTLIVSQALADVIRSSLEVSRQSDGAFDITVKPLLKLWNFKEKLKPSQEKIDSVMQFVGYEKIILHQDTLIKKENIQIDLGGISKGFIIDSTIKMISQIDGIKGVLLNIGGDLSTRGTKMKNKDDWTIGIQNPRNSNELFNKVEIESGKSVATSGDYFRFFIGEDGLRYSHIIDPHSGCPVKEEIVSATIIADDAVVADALATTVLVLGEKKSVEFLEKYYPQVQYYLISHIEDQFSFQTNIVQ